MHVLRRSSSSYRLAMRLSSSVLRRPFLRVFVHHRETTSSPWNIRSEIKPRKAGISLILLPQKEEERRLIRNQPDSARFSRISKIPSNQQDSPEPARFSRIGQTPSLGFAASESSRHSPTASRHRAISPHSYPQLGTQPCRVICHQGIHRTFSGSWDIIMWAQGHCLLTVVRCPVPFLWVF